MNWRVSFHRHHDYKFSFERGNVQMWLIYLPFQSGMSAVTFIAWKADLLVLGDVDGNLNIWDLKGKLSRYYVYSTGESVPLHYMQSFSSQAKTCKVWIKERGVAVWSTACFLESQFVGFQSHHMMALLDDRSCRFQMNKFESKCWLILETGERRSASRTDIDRRTL